MFTVPSKFICFIFLKCVIKVFQVGIHIRVSGQDHRITPKTDNWHSHVYGITRMINNYIFSNYQMHIESALLYILVNIVNMGYYNIDGM